MAKTTVSHQCTICGNRMRMMAQEGDVNVLFRCRCGNDALISLEGGRRESEMI